MKIQINKNQNVFFCSDPHYGHAGIVRGTSNWENKRSCRPFDTLEGHDAQLVHNINTMVRPDDILFCLGDWSFGNYKDNEAVTNIRKFRENIKCKNIHLIMGNHDQEIRRNEDNVQEIFSSVSEYKELFIVEESPKERGVRPHKQNIILSHYAMRVWHNSHRGAWMLYGHSHGTLDEMTPEISNPQWIGDQYYVKNFRTMDVGFDTHKEFRPYSYKELKDIMNIRNVGLEVDHHVGS
jgi:calcineurin-like phosphoesterase family protein